MRKHVIDYEYNGIPKVEVLINVLVGIFNFISIIPWGKLAEIYFREAKLEFDVVRK